MQNACRILITPSQEVLPADTKQRGEDPAQRRLPTHRKNSQCCWRSPCVRCLSSRSVPCGLVVGGPATRPRTAVRSCPEAVILPERCADLDAFPGPWPQTKRFLSTRNLTWAERSAWTGKRNGVAAHNPASPCWLAAAAVRMTRQRPPACIPGKSKRRTPGAACPTSTAEPWRGSW